MGQNTTKKPVRKPSKDFPLTPHRSGKWCKKVRGKLHYFGRLENPQAALEDWLAVKDDLLAGRTPRANREGLTVRDLANRFCTEKQIKRDAGELSPRTWQDYYNACELVVTEFGTDRLLIDLRPDDFAKLRAAMSQKWGLVRVGNVVQYIRVLFKFAYEMELIEVPVRVGPGFKRPARNALRKARNAKDLRLFTASDLTTAIDAAGPTMKAMILLGINAGLGNGDVGRLEFRHLDLGDGWINFPRPKTGVARRCPLWPETVKSLKDAIQHRPAPKDAAHQQMVFITKYGGSWHKDTTDSPVAKEFAKLLKELKLKRAGLSFYALRHQVETVGGAAKDQTALDCIMGHADASISDHYREGLPADERLKAVTDHVRGWLYPVVQPTKPAPTKRKATGEAK